MGANGHSSSNGHVAKSNGRSSPKEDTVLKKAVSSSFANEVDNGVVTITSITPERDSNGEIRYFRHGTIVTHWEIKHELPGRLRLRNQTIHRKAEICQASSAN